MKIKTTFLFFALLLGWNMNAQTSEEQPQKTKVVIEDVYHEVDVLARYHGGYDVVMKKVEAATKNCKKRKLKGKRKNAVVVAELLINRKGEVVEVNIVKSEADFCDEAIIKALKETNHWIPALINNKPVNSYLQFTVNLQNSYRNEKMNASSALN